MALRECDKCGQMVDEAKAFCPSCDNVFLEEEQRQDVSKFEKLDKTVQLGNTMYDMMLSDMGLNIAKPKSQPEKRIEVIAPIGGSAAAKQKEPEKSAAAAKKSLKWLWIGLALFALLVLLPFAVVSVYILVRAVMARN